MKDEWLKYEIEIRSRIYTWYHKRNCSLTQLAYDIAGDVYNRGDGLVFMDFNEYHQRCYLRPEFFEWMKLLVKELEELIGKKAKFIDLPYKEN